jgi:hypothetical protein
MNMETYACMPTNHRAQLPPERFLEGLFPQGLDLSLPL